MPAEIFAHLPETFIAGAVKTQMSFYFSLGDLKKTVRISSDACSVEDGRTLENADCVCKTSPEFFLRIWKEGYRPGMKDFLSGVIKSNNPGALKEFLRCFGKAA